MYKPRISDLRLTRQGAIDGCCAGSGDQQCEQSPQIKDDQLAVIARRTFAEERELMHESPGHEDVCEAAERGPSGASPTISRIPQMKSEKNAKKKERAALSLWHRGSGP